MIAGCTKFAPNQLFSITARDFYSSDVSNESELIAVMEKHASVVVFDKGSIVRAWRRTVANKYSNLPDIRELQDFLALRNHGQDAMKVNDNCYTGPLKNTPMKIAKGMNASDMALPCVGHSYYALGMVRNCHKASKPI